ncbi:MAG: DUF4249 domain-containing protein [Ekhidna sp.]|nr:DUF4249 domain-containing protein [Ekhidna sp.]
MKRLKYLALLFLFGCEEVVIVDLPSEQNLIVVEGWLSDSLGNQPIRLTRSNSFDAENPIEPIIDAQVLVQSRIGELFSYSHSKSGYYHAETPFRGEEGREYRMLALIDTIEIRSEWDRMPNKIIISGIQSFSFQENDPNNSDQQITIYYPKVTAIDPLGTRNFYRWIFFKNTEILNDIEPITIQNDRLFDGNIIPNDFQGFQYEAGEIMTVQLQSISQASHDYLSLLRSQLTTLGTAGGTTPAIVEGNVRNLEDPTNQILGYFGTIAISQDSVLAE